MPGLSLEWFCLLSFQLRSIDAGQPVLCCDRIATGIAVVTTVDSEASLISKTAAKAIQSCIRCLTETIAIVD